jgi:hypothetical protein
LALEAMPEQIVCKEVLATIPYLVRLLLLGVVEVETDNPQLEPAQTEVLEVAVAVHFQVQMLVVQETHLLLRPLREITVAQEQPQAEHHLVAVAVQRQRVVIVRPVNLVTEEMELHHQFLVHL